MQEIQNAFSQSENELEKTRSMAMMTLVESALLDVGGNTYDKIFKSLQERYQCGIVECCNHPEYLYGLLKTLDSKTRNKVIKSIKKQSAKFSYVEEISKLIEAISK